MIQYCVIVGNKEKLVSDMEAEAHTKAASLSLELKKTTTVAARELKKRGLKIIAAYKDGKRR